MDVLVVTGEEGGLETSRGVRNRCIEDKRESGDGLSRWYTYMNTRIDWIGMGWEKFFSGFYFSLAHRFSTLPFEEPERGLFPFL